MKWKREEEEGKRAEFFVVFFLAAFYFSSLSVSCFVFLLSSHRTLLSFLFRVESPDFEQKVQKKSKRYGSIKWNRQRFFV